MALRILPDFLSKEAGQDFAEYAVLLGLIALVVIVSVAAYGVNLAGYRAWIAGSLP